MTSVLQRTARDYMTAPVVTASVDDDVTDVARKLQERHISCVGVLGGDGKLAGIVSLTDLLQLGHIMARTLGGHAALQLPAMCVGDMMTRDPITCTTDDKLGDAARRLVDRRINRLFVLDGDRPIGVLSTRDLMRAVKDEKLAARVDTAMTPTPSTVGAAEPLSVATERLYHARITGLVVMDGADVAGIFTQTEALAARDLDATTPVSQAVGYSMVALPPHTPLWRAAAFAVATRARRVVVVEHRDVKGVLTGLDFAKAAIA